MPDQNITQGLFDIASILKGLLGDTKLNWPGDRPKLKTAIKAVGEWAKTIVEMRWDLDDVGIDKLVELLDTFIDSSKAADHQPLIVGAAEEDYTVAQATEFLTEFGTLVPEETRQKVMAHPEVLKSLKRLGRDQQIKVLNRQDLLDLLIKWGPIILRIVLLFII